MLGGKPTDEMTRNAFQPYLKPGETLQHTAYGIKQPHILLIAGLMLLAILPGAIAAYVLMKHYRVGLTDQRLIILQTKDMKSLQVKEMREFDLGDLKGMDVKTSIGPIFTNLNIADAEKPFFAKFHRAYSKTNRSESKGIVDGISGARAFT